MDNVKDIRLITTVDGMQYTFPADKGTPQLWCVEMGMRCVSDEGTLPNYVPIRKEFFVERSVLEKAGLVPDVRTKREREETPIVPETPQGLMLRLLSLLGIYPTE